MTSVQLQKIDQTFGEKQVLDGLDLSVDSGQYVVLLGPSGCGKTTILRIIAGLQSPDQGDVLFDGQRVNRVPPRNRDVAMVFQQDGLYPHLTVGESIRFALRGKVSPAEMKSRVDEAVGLTRTESVLDRYPKGLSGGELRRAAVAKAIARRSSVRLLDEPLSALDVPVRHALQDDILRWHTSVAGTTIHVTHDGQEAMRMADKIAVMEAGHVAQFATPAEVYGRPHSVSVAQAIGSPPINLFHAVLAGGKIEFANPRISFPLNVRSSSEHPRLLVGVRPDSLHFDSEPAARGPASLVVTGDSIRTQNVGRDVHLHLRLGEDVVIAVVPGVDVKEAPPSGEKICLVAAERDVQLFDADSGRRIGDD